MNAILTTGYTFLLQLDILIFFNWIKSETLGLSEEMIQQVKYINVNDSMIATDKNTVQIEWLLASSINPSVVRLDRNWGKKCAVCSFWLSPLIALFFFVRTLRLVQIIKKRVPPFSSLAVDEGASIHSVPNVLYLYKIVEKVIRRNTVIHLANCFNLLMKYVNIITKYCQTMFCRNLKRNSKEAQWKSNKFQNLLAKRLSGKAATGTIVKYDPN